MTGAVSFKILNSFRTLSSWGNGNYRPSAPLLYEVASHVKQLPFRPLLLLLLHLRMFEAGNTRYLYVVDQGYDVECTEDDPGEKASTQHSGQLQRCFF